jgi:predicted class III extradiol MEMO1 family dioxygenase
MSNSVDEEEHSIEMHLPYTYKVFERYLQCIFSVTILYSLPIQSMHSKIDQIKLVPIMVGSISSEKEKLYGEALAPYLSDPATLFIISSDFCHWYVI